MNNNSFGGSNHLSLSHVFSTAQYCCGNGPTLNYSTTEEDLLMNQQESYRGGQCNEPNFLQLDIIDLMQSWELLNIVKMTQKDKMPLTPHNDEGGDVFLHLYETTYPQRSECNHTSSPSSSSSPPLEPIETIKSGDDLPTNGEEHQCQVNDDNALDKFLISCLQNYQFPPCKTPNSTTTTTTAATKPEKKSQVDHCRTSITTNTSLLQNNGKKRKVCPSPPPLFESKRKTSISSITITSSTSAISNPKHLKRRRKYQKRKNSAYTNPAQTMMEFHFPVWTFHVEQ